MWRIIYNVLSLAAFSVFLPIAVFNTKIRANFLDRLYPRPTGVPGRGTVWIHAASVGEVVIADNLIKYWKTKSGREQFLITTNTKYAGEMAKKNLPDALVCSAPFDLFWSVRRFLRRVKPRVLIIIETEIWPNIIWESKRLGIPVIIINGRISDNTLATYRKFSFFFRSTLRYIDLVLAQSEQQSRRFIEIGMDKGKVLISGNIKYYRQSSLALVDRANRHFVTFGSVREKEVEPITDVIRKLRKTNPELTCVIAPREMPLVENISKRLQKYFRVMLYSGCKGENASNADVILVDTVGDLFTLYRESLVAFVGGSLFPYGGQNILEPLFFGTPVLFGPHTENFQDITDNILINKAGFRISDSLELLEGISTLLNDTAMWETTSRNGLEYVIKQKHAIEETVASILQLANAQ